MKLYQIDYKKLVLLLLPTPLRKSRMFAFLCALTFGVTALHEQFLKSRDRHLLRLRRNGQVCYLRGILNDEFDTKERRIRITDGKEGGDWVVARDEEEAYQLLVAGDGPMLYSEELIVVDADFFSVYVPWGKEEENKNTRLRSCLNEYKLISKKYVIKNEQTEF